MNIFVDAGLNIENFAETTVEIHCEIVARQQVFDLTVDTFKK